MNKYVATLSLIFLLATAQLWAWQGSGKGRDKNCIKTELNLSEEQTTQMAQLREAHQVKVTPLREEIRALQTKLANPEISDAEAEALAQQIGQKHTEKSLLKVQHMKEIKAILTPEQFTKFQEHHQKKMDQRGKGKGKGKGKGHRGGHCNK